MKHPWTMLPLLALVALGGCRRDGGNTEALAAASENPSAAAPPLSASSSASEPDPEAAPEPPPQEGPAPVDLHGKNYPRPAAPEGAPRLASISMQTYVRSRPKASASIVGSLRAGAIVEMEPGEHGKEDCPGGWRKIKPVGFVCVGSEATLDLNHPIVRAVTRQPDLSQKLPYMYGIVTRGGPVYAKIPSEAELREYEPHLDGHIKKWKKDKKSGAEYGFDVWAKWKNEPLPPALDALEERTTDKDIPWFLRDGAVVPNLSGQVKSDKLVKIGEISRRNGAAFIETFLYEGRRYNVTTDLRVIPADRFRPIRGSDFHGYIIGEDVEFPFALIRRPGGKRYKWDGAKKKLTEAGPLEWRSALSLTGKQKFFKGRLHYETKDGEWISDRYAGRVDPAKRMPAWGKNGEKWIDINITKQVLVAYEGTKAVYATLISSGEAGLDDPEKTKSTKRGIFRIHTKHISTTMDSNVVGEEFELRDVPYVQYFQDGYALHGAYWHDGFGRPKSHGCINLSPEDARRLFFWTEPAVPPGWHGAARTLTGTVVFIHA